MQISCNYHQPKNKKEYKILIAYCQEKNVSVYSAWNEEKNQQEILKRQYRKFWMAGRKQQEMGYSIMQQNISLNIPRRN